MMNLADATVPLPSGAQIPMLGFGTWKLSGNEAYTAVRSALEAGYRHIDTATMYENEAEVGKAIRDSGIAREELFVTTKLPEGAVGQEQETLKQSLSLLGLDQVDLWLIHWPPNGHAAVPTWEQFLLLRDKGLVRDVGVSNYSTAQIDALIAATSTPPAVNQIRWSPFQYDEARLTENTSRGVVLEGYSPFRASQLDDTVLVGIADSNNVTPAQVIVRWHLQTGVVVIPKSSNPERIAANADVFGFELSDDEVEVMNRLAG